MDEPSALRKDLHPWTPQNHSTTTPRPIARGTDNTIFLSDRWIEKGDYLRVQNIVFGYTLPTVLLQRLRVAAGGQSRIYLNMQNVYTFTGYSNWDPETLGFGNPLGRGVDEGAIYPNVRTISLGLDLKL
jgi:hypothetical protein